MNSLPEDTNFSKFEIDYKKDMEKEDELEILKLRDPNVHVFSLPPMTSSKGHTTSDFTNLVFKGMMKMTVKGQYMFIYFLNPDNTIFIVSIVDANYEKFILPLPDILLLELLMKMVFHNQFGIAFKQRNAAFYFKKNLMILKKVINLKLNLK